MVRRIVMGLFGVALLALIGPAQGWTKEDVVIQKSPHAHGPHTVCAKACAECTLHCDSCFAHCSHLVADGKKEHMSTMYLCNDCATTCAAAAQIVSRNGPLSATICESCAKACDTCGAACEKHPADEHMAACAKACRTCATACRDMIKHAGHAVETKRN
jgi:hypothetical protein